MSPAIISQTFYQFSCQSSSTCTSECGTYYWPDFDQISNIGFFDQQKQEQQHKQQQPQQWQPQQQLSWVVTQLNLI